MSKMAFNLIVLHIFSLLSAFNCQVRFDSDQELPPGKQGFKFRTPELNEEEQHSSFMPDGLLKCDACKAVAFQAS